MAFQPAGSLTNRTFVGLIIAQFLAGFNDQAIHAMSMFYAIRIGILNEANAISLMPILFYAPWAIFCTLAGYYADRYSKTYTLVTWKVAEIVISLVLILGFYLGTNHGDDPTLRTLGGWLIMSTVFMMGTHAAFFAPAKYGAMPEILQGHVLSRGNGILESTTFLASILGTVSGGFLITEFRGMEIWIGVIMLGLSTIGAVASLLIAYLPPANPARLFPVNPITPLLKNLKLLFSSRPLALSVTGIAFFIFMVAYMRGSVYMHGEAHHWTEASTSLVVATVAIGVTFGTPLAGYLSGGKVELGMVPLGCLGMMFACLLAGIAIEHVLVLVVALAIIGFFSGFYMVPLYTLLQHRAPKTSKGDLVATSNFVNVIGAISASILFNLLVRFSQLTGVAPLVDQTDQVVGTYADLEKDKRTGRLVEVTIRSNDGTLTKYQAPHPFNDFWADELLEDEADRAAGIQIIELNDDLLEILGNKLKIGDPVIVSSYTLRDATHYLVRGADQPQRNVYDYEILPRYLFIGAGLMTLVILILICRKLPDFFVRMLFWLRSLGRFQLRAIGMQHLPTNGPVILATNCTDLKSGLQLVSATDRTTKVVLPAGTMRDGSLLRTLARGTNVLELPGEATGAALERVEHAAVEALAGGHLLALCVDGAALEAELELFLAKLRRDVIAPVIPVYCGNIDPAAATPKVRVVFGQPLAEGTPLPEMRAAIAKLGDWIRHNDDVAEEHH